MHSWPSWRPDLPTVRAVKTESGARSRRAQRWVHGIWTVLIVGAAAAILIGAALSKPGPDDCEGIGWGCNLYGGAAALFDAIVVVPIALLLLLVGNGIIAVVGRLARKRARPADAGTTRSEDAWNAHP